MENEVVLQPDEMIVKMSDYEALVVTLEEKDADIQVLKEAVISVFGLLGLTHPGTKRIDEDYLNGKKSIFKPIFKEISSTAADLGVISMGLDLGGKKEAEMAEKFKFMKTILPLLQKYGAEHTGSGDQKQLAGPGTKQLGK